MAYINTDDVRKIVNNILDSTLAVPAERTKEVLALEYGKLRGALLSLSSLVNDFDEED